MAKFLKAYRPKEDETDYFLINSDQITHILDTDEHDVTVWLVNGDEFCLLEIDTIEQLLKLIE